MNTETILRTASVSIPSEELEGRIASTIQKAQAENVSVNENDGNITLEGNNRRVILNVTQGEEANQYGFSMNTEIEGVNPELTFAILGFKSIQEAKYTALQEGLSVVQGGS